MKKIALTIMMFCVLVSLAHADPIQNTTNTTVQGGNITLVNFDTAQISSIWQGFFGTVSGGLTLSNSGGDTFYDWNLVDARGEVLATRHIITDWSTINCTLQNQIYMEEYRLDITNATSDGINDTYKNTTHPLFDIGFKTLSGCRSTLTDNSTAKKVVFWNVLLNADENETVFVSIMDDNTVGFNGTVVDYQLLVPANRSTGTAAYNLYLDLT
jgi:hypothetical protein